MLYRFSTFELDDRRFELRRAGVRVPLPARPFDVLLALVRRRGDVLSWAQLMATAWTGVTVTKDSVTQAVAAVRKALGDDDENPRFVRTVRKRGYAFCAAVTELPGDGGPSAEPRPRAAGPRHLVLVAGGAREGVAPADAMPALAAGSGLASLLGSATALDGDLGSIHRMRVGELLAELGAIAVVVVAGAAAPPSGDARHPRFGGEAGPRPSSRSASGEHPRIRRAR